MCDSMSDGIWRTLIAAKTSQRESRFECVGVGEWDLTPGCSQIEASLSKPAALKLNLRTRRPASGR